MIVRSGRIQASEHIYLLLPASRIMAFFEERMTRKSIFFSFLRRLSPPPHARRSFVFLGQSTETAFAGYLELVANNPAGHRGQCVALELAMRVGIATTITEVK